MQSEMKNNFYKKLRRTMTTACLKVIIYKIHIKTMQN